VYSDFYEIPLPALHFEKVEEIDIKENRNPEERNDAFQTTRRFNDVRKRMTRTLHSPRQGSQNRNCRKDDSQGRYDASRKTEKRHAETTSNKRFPEWRAE
jgi:hypothetical protein